ncbi:MAG: hypothetical protein QCH35_06035 [Methanomicrobiaceae archaeon]|nr:hypothetical protein [Methanomicrobiaceae archaeon]
MEEIFFIPGGNTPATGHPDSFPPDISSLGIIAVLGPSAGVTAAIADDST